MNTAKQLVLVTGGSSGIGLHLSHEFARHGHPVAIVAPVAEELEEVATWIRREHRVDVTPIPADLRDPGAPGTIRDALGDREVEILVNNAGHGQKGRAWEIPLEDDLSMVALNIEAVLRMTKAFLPPMVQRKHGRVLNTASVAGFEPGPGYAVYSSTKAFVLSYSEALATELQETGVTVTALCPGPTDTDFFPKADMMASRAFQKAQLMAPQDVAAAAYSAAMRGERVVVPGFSNKALVFLRRLIPESMQARLNEMLVEDVPDDQMRRERGVKEFQ